MHYFTGPPSPNPAGMDDDDGDPLWLVDDIFEGWDDEDDEIPYAPYNDDDDDDWGDVLDDDDLPGYVDIENAKWDDGRDEEDGGEDSGTLKDGDLKYLKLSSGDNGNVNVNNNQDVEVLSANQSQGNSVVLDRGRIYIYTTNNRKIELVEGKDYYYKNGTAYYYNQPYNAVDGVERVLTCNGDGLTFAIKENGELWGWGNDLFSEFGIDTDSYGPLKIMDGVKDMVATYYSCVGLKENGELWIWGRNNHYSYQKGRIEPPQKVFDNVSMICNDYYCPYVIMENGELWQCFIMPLNDGSGNNQIVTNKMMNDVKMFSGDDQVCMAVTTDNRLIIWDRNEKTPHNIILDGITPVPNV